MSETTKVDPKLDLVLERTVEVPCKYVWQGWTQGQHLKAWFCPRPWSIESCHIESSPGGAFNFTMKSPEGELFPNVGCVLEVIDNKKLVWTSALQSGFRPVGNLQSGANLYFSASMRFEDLGKQTKIKAIAMHKDEADCQKHDEMGFHKGWGICIDQLVEHIKTNML